MSIPEIIGTTVSGWLIAAFGWLKWWYEIREKRRERAAKERAEAALLEIKRRAIDSSLYLLISEHRFNGITAPSDKPTEQFFIPPNDPCLLCFMRDEVDRKMPSGQPTYLLVENHGCDAYEISIQLDGEAVGFIQVNADEAYPLHAIRYPYRPESHGKDQTIQIGFLAANGVRDTHRYMTRHGIRTLKRIDPT